VKNERFFKSFTLQVCVCAAPTNLEFAKSSAEMRENMKRTDFAKESQYKYYFSALAQNFPDIVRQQGKETVFQFSSLPVAADWKAGDDEAAYNIANAVPADIGGFYIPGAAKVSRSYQDLIMTIKPKIADKNEDYKKIRIKIQNHTNLISSINKEIHEEYLLWCSKNPGIDGMPSMSEDSWLESRHGRAYKIQLDEQYGIIDELTEEYKNILQSMDAPLKNAIKRLQENTMTIVSGGKTIEVPEATISGNIVQDKNRWDNYSDDEYDFVTEINKDAEIKTEWKTIYDVKVNHSCHSSNIEQKVKVSRIIADEHYNLKVRFKGMKAYQVNRGEWYDDTFVNTNIELVQGSALNAEYFFGKQGSLHLIPLVILVGYSPEFEMTISKEVYEQEFNEKAFIGIDYVNLFGIKFHINGRASLLPKPIDNEVMSITFKSPMDTSPQVIGVTSAVKVLQKK